MKKMFYILVSLGITLTYIFTVSCNKVVTYEEKKAAEKRIIKRILAEKDIEVLEAYPTSGVFGENQFVQLSSGIYLNIVDSGNGNRATFEGTNSTTVLVRARGEYYYSDTAVTFNTFLNTYPPFEFKYGYAYNTVEENKYASNIYYYFFGVGFESILSFVGDSAIVKMLVPGYAEIRSGNGTLAAGSSFQSSAGSYFIPIFYDRVRFTFY